MDSSFQSKVNMTVLFDQFCDLVERGRKAGKSVLVCSAKGRNRWVMSPLGAPHSTSMYLYVLVQPSFSLLFLYYYYHFFLVITAASFFIIATITLPLVYIVLQGPSVLRRLLNKQGEDESPASGCEGS